MTDFDKEEFVLPEGYYGNTVSQLPNSGGNNDLYIKIPTGEKKRVVFPYGVNPPEGERPSTKNCIVRANMFHYTYLNSEGIRRTLAWSFANESDPRFKIGQELRIKPKLHNFSVVLVQEGDAWIEKIFRVPNSVIKALEDIEEMIGGSIKGQIIQISHPEKMQYQVMPTGQNIDLAPNVPQLSVKRSFWKDEEEVVDVLKELGIYPIADHKQEINDILNKVRATLPANQQFQVQDQSPQDVEETS